jgi:hypothetical protein
MSGWRLGIEWRDPHRHRWSFVENTSSDLWTTKKKKKIKKKKKKKKKSE